MELICPAMVLSRGGRGASPRRLLPLASLALLAGCFQPDIGEGAVACGPAGECPPAFRCFGDSRCYRAEPPPPSAPSGLAARPISAFQVDLAWDHASAAAGLARYEVFRDGALLEDTVEPRFTDASSTLAPSHGYTWGVRAVDQLGRRSALASVEAATLAEGSTDLSFSKTSTAPAIDGSLEDWGLASVGWALTPRPTAVRGLWDASALYLAFEVFDPDLDAPTATQDRDASLAGEDSVELFLDRDGDGGSAPAGARYMDGDDVRLIVSARGAIFDARGQDAAPSAALVPGDWNPSWRSQAVAGPGRYLVELAVPWSSLGSGPPSTGDRLPMGFVINDRVGTATRSVLWPERESSADLSFENAANWQKVTMAP